MKLFSNVNIVYGNLKSENSQEYAQKPQRNCTFMNAASGFKKKELRVLQMLYWVHPAQPPYKKQTRPHLPLKNKETKREKREVAIMAV